jgi:hypothetical protein
LFNINGEEWGVLLVSPDHPCLNRSDGGSSIGVCDDQAKYIFISDTLPDKLLKKVLCHEIVHAAMFSYNIELSYEQEEVVADLVATYG